MWVYEVFRRLGDDACLFGSGAWILICMCLNDYELGLELCAETGNGKIVVIFRFDGLCNCSCSLFIEEMASRSYTGQHECHIGAY